MNTYEIKYQKLIDAIKKLRDNNPSDENIQNWVNDNVLELKNNEDEKMKELIHNLITGHSDTPLSKEIYSIYGKSKEQVIEWLEKQKESFGDYDCTAVDLNKFDDKIQEFDDMLEDQPKPYWDGWYEAMEWIRTHGSPFEKKGQVKGLAFNGDKSFIEDIKDVIGDSPLVLQSDKDKMIDWLEKQIYTKKELQEMGFAFTTNGDIVTPKQQEKDIKAYKKWLEKQDDCITLPLSANTSIKTVNEFADKYSHVIWEMLMDKFNKIENYHIGCNDVSDIVLNAIINTFNWLEKQGCCNRYSQSAMWHNKEEKPVDMKPILIEYEADYNISHQVGYYNADTKTFNIRGTSVSPIKWVYMDELLVDCCTKEEYANKEYWRGYREGKQEIHDKYSEYDILAKWQKNFDGNKPSKNHSVLMKTTHGIAEGEWNGEQWLQYRWSSKLNDKDVLYWVELSDLEKHKSDDTDAKIVSECLKKMGGDKPTMATMDRQKPANKFKEGDWIVYNGNTYRIESVTEDGYCNNHQGFIPKTCEKEMKLWSIEDAKYGDILVSRYNHPFIYNGTFNSFSVGAIGGIECEGEYFILGEDGFFWTDNINIKPANEEQRTILFEKMHYASYQWYDENKELKKIEQNPTDKGKNDAPNGQKPTETEYVDAEKASEEYRNYRMSCGIKDPVMLDEIESAYYEGATRQKSYEWGEDDEHKLNGICSYLNCSDSLEGHTKWVDWLKSLKDRVIPQPRQEWSEGDEKNLQIALDMVEWYSGKNEDKSRAISDWLKSLKNRI